jgi:hypothetical protein
MRCAPACPPTPRHPLRSSSPARCALCGSGQRRCVPCRARQEPRGATRDARLRSPGAALPRKPAARPESLQRIVHLHATKKIPSKNNCIFVYLPVFKANSAGGLMVRMARQIPEEPAGFRISRKDMEDSCASGRLSFLPSRRWARPDSSWPVQRPPRYRSRLLACGSPISPRTSPPGRPQGAPRRTGILLLCQGRPQGHPRRTQRSSPRMTDGDRLSPPTIGGDLISTTTRARRCSLAP